MPPTLRELGVDRQGQIHKNASITLFNFVFTNLSVTYFAWFYQCYQLIIVYTCLCMIVKGDTFEVNRNKQQIN